MFKKFVVPLQPPFSSRVKILRYTRNNPLYGVDKHFQKDLYLTGILQELLYLQTLSTYTLYYTDTWKCVSMIVWQSAEGR